MKAFLNILSSSWFYLSFKFFEFIMGKEKIIDELSSYVQKMIIEDIKASVEIFKDMKDDEVFIMKDLLYNFYTTNFRFLKKEEKIIKEKVYKNIDIKINWILSNR